MTLLSPLALALSALAAPIVLMYILKLRRKQQTISSTLLWQRALDDVQANAPWQRLRPSILLLLQLLALLALVLTLARPAYTSSRRFAGDLILIVDESYGMQAHDIAPSRFAAALTQAHSLAGDLPDGNVASVIGMGVQPRLAIAESSDSGAVSQAIDGLQPGVSSPNFLGALSLAASLARSGQTTRVVVLTSRESGISTLPLQVAFPVEIVRIGAKQLHDLAIIAFSAARNGSHTTALTRIGNFGGATENSDLDLDVDGQLADVRPLSIDPGKTQTLFWTDLPKTAHTLHARLARPDDVTADKSAWVVADSGGQRRVLLVGAGDYFVQTALGLDPAVQLSTIAPAAYRASLAKGYDLVVFDGVLPPSLPATPVLILSPTLGRAGPVTFGRYQPGGTVSAMTTSSSSATANLLQYVDLSDVHIGRARSVSLPAWMVPIADVAQGPRPAAGSARATLLAAGESNGRRMAVVTFNLQESDWPLRISFPILIQNLLHYLVPGLALGGSDILAGQPVQLLPPAGTSSVVITRAGGGTDTVNPPFAPFTDTSQPGIYTATATGGLGPSSVSFAVNFFPARPAPATGRPDVILGHAASGTSQSVSSPVSISWIVVLVVLAVLTAEWWLWAMGRGPWAAISRLIAQRSRHAQRVPEARPPPAEAHSSKLKAP